MYVSETPLGTPFAKGSMRPYGPISLEPAATVLNYGQGLFEGMKAMRNSSGGVSMFRPDRNAARAANGCERLLMPKMAEDVFFDGVFQTVRANAHWIPPAGVGSLYIRPIITGTGPSLGVAPSPSFHFIVYACPVGAYFKPGAASKGIDLRVCETFHRAAPKGAGNTKSISNYAPAFKAQQEAKGDGYAEAIFLDTTDRYVEEAGAANFFVVDKSGVVRTPGLGSILPGVTRESVLRLAADLGLEVREGPLHVDEVMQAREAWCAGTAAVISPVGSVTYKGHKHEYQTTETSDRIHKLFKEILDGKHPSYNWIVDPFKQ